MFCFVLSFLFYPVILHSMVIDRSTAQAPKSAIFHYVSSVASAAKQRFASTSRAPWEPI